MPVYDYKCQEHGLFYELATIEESDQPKPCPHCQQLCARVIVIAPDVLTMDKEKKHAHAVNEKNQHEPTFSTKARRQDDHQHKHGCGCEKKMGKSKLMYTAQGEKMFPSMRPWMISH